MAAEPGPSKRQSGSTATQDFRNNASNIESARFLKRILQKAEEEVVRLSNKTLPDQCERAYIYTGLDKRVFPILRNEINITDLREIDRSLIHSHLLAFYLNEAITSQRLTLIPTTKNLFKSLYGKIPAYIDIRTFRKYLAKMGYIWLKIAKGYIVMERPSVTFERYYYLNDIAKYREENREIFYVDETVLTSDFSYYSYRKYSSLMKAAARGGFEVSQNDLIKSIYAVSKTGIHALETIDDFNASNFENWILNDLLPILPEKSVVVIKTAEHHNDVIKKPTLYSIKSEMMDWLDRNNVPYDENMSKCELVTLIDTYTSEVDEISKIGDNIKLKGHAFLRLPLCIDDLSLTQHVFELIKVNIAGLDVHYKDALKKIQETVSPATLEEYIEFVADNERETMTVDMRMDEVIDGIIKGLLNLRVRELEDSEVPFSDSD